MAETDVRTLTLGEGDAGNIAMNANSISVSNSTISSSSESDQAGSGDAGSIDIEGISISISNLSKISTEVKGDGAGGTITITATGGNTLTLNNSEINATVNNVSGTSQASSGLANIHLASPTFQMNGGSLKAETTGSRDAGTIGITGQDLTFANALVSTASTSQGVNPGNAGNISATAGNNLSILSNSVFSTAAKDASGGNIELQALNLSRIF